MHLLCILKHTFFSFFSLGQEKIAGVLIEHGADVNLKDNNGWTPIFIAAASGKSLN